jgi:cytochrome b subunit of formate dehydrogenase
MSNTEIKEGLKSALARGETIKKAMNSFINAGYKLEEVEKASNELQGINLSQEKESSHVNKPQTNVSPPNQKSPIQKVSNYGNSAHPDVLGKKIIIYGLISILILLLVGGVLIFFFREQVTSFFENLF